MFSTIEISMPISPRQMLPYLARPTNVWRDKAGRICEHRQPVVAEFNRRTSTFADREFVVDHNNFDHGRYQRRLWASLKVDGAMGMTAADEIETIVKEMGGILSRFKRDRDGVWVADGDQATFTGLVLEASDILSQALGTDNSFRFLLEQARLEGISNFTGSQSYHSVEESIGILRSAATTIRRQFASPAPPVAVSLPPYIDLQRIESLRKIVSKQWDFRRLVRLCEEVNASFSAGNLLATAMLIRAITDHVPPLFAANSFPAYVSSISGKSHRSSMDRLRGCLRDIADGMLHQGIRSRESLPTPTQVDFRQEVDQLLGEVMRVTE